MNVWDALSHQGIDDTNAAYRDLYRHVVEATGAATWLLDLVSGDLDINDRWAAMLGRSRDDLGALTVEDALDLMHEQDAERCRVELARTVDGGNGEFRFECRFQHVDGHWVWVRTHGSVLKRDADGTPLLMCGTNLDISEEKRAARQMADLEAYLYRVLDRIYANVGLLDRNGNMLWANQGPLEIANVELADVAGCHFADTPWFAACEDSRQMLRDACAGALRGEERRFEVEGHAADGATLLFDMMIAPLPDPDGRVTHLLVTSVDVSERAAAMREMRDARHHLETLIENIPAMVYVKNAADLRYVTLNREGERLLGHSRAELLGKNAYDLFPADQAEQFEAHDRRALEIEGSTPMLDQAFTAEGNVHYARTSKIALRDVDGNPTHLVGISMDISELHSARDELEHHKAELERRVIERTRLLSESEQRFRSALRDSSIGMALVSTEGRWMEVNAALARMLGYSERELNAMDFQSVTHPDDLKSDLAQLERLVSGEISTYMMEKRYLRSDGSQMWAKLNVTRADSDDGELLHFIAQIQDISVEKLRNAATDVITNELSELSGEDYCNHAALRLGEILKADVAFISELTPGRDDELRTVSLVQDGRRMPQNRYPVSATPFAEVVQTGEALVFEKGIQSRYPDHPYYAEKGIEAYAAAPMFNSRGHLVGYLGIMHRAPIVGDSGLTEVLHIFGSSVAAALERDRTLKQYHDFIEFAPDAMVLFDDSGQVRLANHAMERLLGIRRAELYGTSFQNLVTSAGYNKIKSLMSALDSQTSKQAQQTMCTALREDGSTFPAEVALNRAISEDGSLYCAVIRDLSRKLEAEREMRQAHAILDATSDAAFIFDVRSQRFNYVNEGAIKQLGYSKGELLQMNPTNIVTREDADRVAGILEHLPQGTEPVTQLRSNHRTKAGELIPVDVKIQYVPPSMGEDGRFIALARDIRDQIEQEADREARLVAEQANAAKSAFLAAMSHEIRTPMNGVIGSMELLARSSLKPHQMDLANTARDSANGLLRIIDDVLDFSKIEAGRIDIEAEPVNLGDAAESVCRALNARAMQAGVDLELYVDPALPSWIASDAVRFRQILNNLVANAIKFSTRDDAPGRVEVRLETSGPAALRIVVADDGIGIEPEALETLFEPFVQAEASTTRRFGGSGLGLSICRRLIDLFGGTIEAASAVGVGSTFTVELPYVVASDAPTVTACPDLTGIDCIIVSDDCMQRAEDWADYLESAGAAAEIVDAAPARQSPAAQSAARVVIVESNSSHAPACRELCTGEPHAACLEIDHGQRREPRQIASRRVGIDGPLLTRRELLTAVALAAGRDVPAREPEPSEFADTLPAAPDRSAAARDGQLVLVAEDNDVNRKVIRQQLALLGFAADVVNDGEEALTAWREGDYGLLLTDLHMPNLDGYALTRAIRAEEEPGRRLPIVALTANALKDEQANCRAAGMDDYLTKPATLDQIESTVLAHITPRQTEADATAADAATNAPRDEGPPLLNVTVLEDLIGADALLIDEFLRDFSRSAEATGDELDEAHRASDLDGVTALAHRLKSSARSVGALALGDRAASLEASARSGAEQALADDFAAFKDCLAQTLRAIAQHHASDAVSASRAASA